MGIAAASDAEALQSLRLWRERRWRAPLPPVVVLRRGCKAQQFAVEITIPERRAAETVEWRIETETGGTIDGSARAESLAVVASGEIDGIPLARRNLPLPTMLPEGYHTLILTFGGRASRCP